MSLLGPGDLPHYLSAPRIFLDNYIILDAAEGSILSSVSTKGFSRATRAHRSQSRGKLTGWTRQLADAPLFATPRGAVRGAGGALVGDDKCGIEIGAPRSCRRPSLCDATRRCKGCRRRPRGRRQVRHRHRRTEELPTPLPARVTAWWSNQVLSSLPFYEIDLNTTELALRPRRGDQSGYLENPREERDPLVQHSQRPSLSPIVRP